MLSHVELHPAFGFCDRLKIQALSASFPLVTTEALLHAYPYCFHGIWSMRSFPYPSGFLWITVIILCHASMLWIPQWVPETMKGPTLCDWMPAQLSYKLEWTVATTCKVLGKQTNRKISRGFFFCQNSQTDYRTEDPFLPDPSNTVPYYFLMGEEFDQCTSLWCVCLDSITVFGAFNNYIIKSNK